MQYVQAVCFALRRVLHCVPSFRHINPMLTKEDAVIGTWAEFINFTGW